MNIYFSTEFLLRQRLGTYVNVQSWIGGLHVCQVCLCHLQIISGSTGLNVLAYFCVDSGSGNVTDIE